MKRILDCCASDFAGCSKQELLHAIKASEGRVMVSETIAIVPSMLFGITNAELAASQGADMILLNMFDAQHPQIMGLPDGIEDSQMITELKRLTGRLVGVNLEAVDPEFSVEHDEIWAMKSGRLATADNVRTLKKMGCDFIVITGNPNNGVSNRAIAASLREIRAQVGEDVLLITGKMHGAGIVNESGAKIITPEEVALFAESGADIALIPAVGTVPGMNEAYVASLIAAAHQKGLLAMTAVGTSQEGADVETIKRIALMSKMAGADLHHIGDTGYAGLALPENIRAYSIAIRGVRHTYTRMARSILR